MTPVRDEYLPVNSAERDGPHIGTSMAAFTQSIQLAESRWARRPRKSKRRSSAMITTIVRGAFGSGRSGGGWTGSGPQAASTAAVPAIAPAPFRSSRRVRDIWVRCSFVARAGRAPEGSGPG